MSKKAKVITSNNSARFYALLRILPQKQLVISLLAVDCLTSFCSF